MKKFKALSALIASIGFVGLLEGPERPNQVLRRRRPSSQLRVNRKFGVKTEDTETAIGAASAQSSERVLFRSVFLTYRETYQIRYLPNDRTKTKLLSRLR